MSIAETRAAVRTRRVAPFEPSKFVPPAEPRHYVGRARVCDLLEDLADYPVSALVAPAGTGKTVAAAAWVRTTSRMCAWLRLDAGDREPSQLWRSVAEALGDELLSSSASGSLRAVGRGRRSADPAPLTLVLDDVQVLDVDDVAVAALESLVRDRPADVHLVLLSRRRLPLPVAGLRAAGTLTDVPADLLRFSEAEAQELVHGIAPDAQDVPLDRFRGWPAALQLWGQSMRSERHPGPGEHRWASSGRFERLLDEYVWDDVLGDERSELLSMLTATTVVGRLNHGLAEALTGGLDAVALLDRAESRGLVTPTTDPGWFSVHPLVREALTRRLGQRRPDRTVVQHTRAARWFESMADLPAAVEHWIGAGQPAEALRVVAANAVDLLETGRLTSLTAEINRARYQLGDGAVAPLTDRAWCELLVGDPEFVETIAEAEALDDDSATDARDPVVEILTAASASWRGDWRACESAALSALGGTDRRVRIDPVGGFGWNLVTLSAALDERWHDDDPSVAAASRAVAGDGRLRRSLQGARALGLALSGRSHAAAAVVERVRSHSPEPTPRPLSEPLELAAAVAARELADRQASSSTLLRLAGRPTPPFPTLQLVAHLELVQLTLSEGKVDEALERFLVSESLADELGRSHPSAWSGRRGAAGTWLGDRVSRTGVELFLALDQPDRAEEWAHRCLDAFWRPLSAARVHLARSDAAQAQDALSRAQSRCVRHDVVLGLARARALAGSDHGQALVVAGDALATSAEEGLLQTAATEGSHVQNLLELSAWRVPEAWMDRLRRILVPTWAGRAIGPIEPLTEREREVLRLLPSRLTLGEIAAELFVSRNTLKFHMRAIYRKLGVDSRGGAVESARELLLLPRG